MKGWVVYSVVVTVVAVGAIGVAAGFAISRATDSNTEAVQATAAPTAQPQATDYVPRLTGIEAAAKAKQRLLNTLASATDSTSEQRAVVSKASCSAEDFNQRDLAWIVVCRVTATGSITYKVSDATGEVEFVSSS
jgi:hypothetical protein